MLVLRDIKLRYKQTFLGIGWVVLQPLMTALLFAVLFGKMMGLSSEGAPYILFAFCGLIPWLVFSGALHRASTCLLNDTRLITKVYFPRIFLPLSATFGVVIDFIISLFMIFILLKIYGTNITRNVLFLPIGSVILFLFSCGINLFVSSLNVYYRDFKHIVPFVLQLWMYASPLVYSSSMIPKKYQMLYICNPMVGMIDFFRWCFLGLEKFPIESFFVSTVFSILMISLGGGIFRKIEHYFADVI